MLYVTLRRVDQSRRIKMPIVMLDEIFYLSVHVHCPLFASLLSMKNISYARGFQVIAARGVYFDQRNAFTKVGL